MIQRKQSLFLLIDAILCIICLMLPLGIFRPQQIGVDTTLYNLWIRLGDGSTNWQSAPLFAILLIHVAISIYTIFIYSKRKLQIKLCTWNIAIIVLWYVVGAIVVFTTGKELEADFKAGFSAILPIISLILVVMARKGVKADEALIRAADRIR